MMTHIGKAVLVSATLWSVVVRGADLMIADVDVRAVSPGAAIVVPVTAGGLSPDSFAGFQLTVTYDTDVLQFTGADRGELIAMTDPAWAAGDYAPSLWALEARASQGRVSVAGMILMDGISVSANNLGQLAAARVPATDGVLVNLNFRLIQQAATALQLGGDDEVDTLVLADTLSLSSSPAVAVPGNPIAGGLITAGLPNWWQLAHFGQVGVSPAGDPDVDTYSNEDEYGMGTDPNVADALVALEKGWNLVSFPLTPDPPDVDSVLDNGDGIPVNSGDVLEWVPTRDGSGDYQPTSLVDAQTGYWVYLMGYNEFVVHVSGTLGDGDVALLAGWNIIGTVRETAPPGDAGTFWRWDPASAAFGAVDAARGETLVPGRGYWLYSESDRVLTLGR